MVRDVVAARDPRDSEGHQAASRGKPLARLEQGVVDGNAQLLGKLGAGIRLGLVRHGTSSRRLYECIQRRGVTRGRRVTLSGP